MNNRRRRCLRAGIFLALIACVVVGRSAQAQVPKPANGGQSLELRVANGRSQFHTGEIIPVELTFYSKDHKKIWIQSRECSPHSVYQYLIQPAGFIDRSFEIDAAMSISELSCGGPGGEIDLSEQPFKVRQVLNERFRMEIPGKYKISVSSTRLDVAVASNVINLEILPRDPVWEKAELKRAIKLLDVPENPEYEQGCNIVRALGTDEANLEMAKRYSGKSNCDFDFASGIISAKNRKAVLAELEAGLSDPSRSISTSYLRTIAFVSIYQQHPEWFPAPAPTSAINDPNATVWAQRSLVWQNYPAVTAEMLRYARSLLAAIPSKTFESRAESLQALLYLDRILGDTPVPEDLRVSARAQMPAQFRRLSHLEQAQALQHSWNKFAGPAMIPVLKDILDHEPKSAPRSSALVRLNELSPAEARPYILHDLRLPYPTMDIQALGHLPEEELPELDGIMLKRVKDWRGGDVSLIRASAFVERYASRAIANELLAFVKEHTDKIYCESQANFIAYFIRVSPHDGTAMLRNEMRRQGPGCLLLRRLASVRMSPEVESEALAQLDNADPEVVRDALYVLQHHGSSKCKPILLKHFRAWHKTWANRTQALEGTEKGRAANLEAAYSSSLNSAQGWLTSKEEFRLLRNLCVTSQCTLQADQIADNASSSPVMIGIAEPVFEDEYHEHFGVAQYGGIQNMDELKQKLAQYPKGTSFMLDARTKEDAMVQRTYNQLKPWIARHGFELSIYK